MFQGLFIDGFAGGGGASTGIAQAIGRDVDIAINHSPTAIAIHKANHPTTEHHCQDIKAIWPRMATRGRRVSGVWMSPDCKEFSKAKGGPLKDRSIRTLAMEIPHWLEETQPDVAYVENVEEFESWGPLEQGEDGKWRVMLDRKGEDFKRWLRLCRRAGYRVDHRQLRACDYGAPTSRKRLYIVMRRDRRPIVWPKATHGAPASPGVRAGKLLPYRTAAECIDWSIACPSIFDRTRPLKDATLRRIAYGVMRYVVNATTPFIVGTAFTNTRASRVFDPLDPLRTSTTQNEYGVVDATLAPHITKFHGGSIGSPIDREMPTVTSNGEPARPAGAMPLGLVAGALAPLQNGERRPGEKPREQAADDPFSTVATGGKFAALGATLYRARNGEREGQAPRALDPLKPLGTVAAEASGFGLAVAHLEKLAENSRGRPFDEPLDTVMAGAARHAPVVTELAFLDRQFGNSIGASADAPAPATTAGGGGKTAAVTAFVSSFNGSDKAAAAGDPKEPLPTVRTSGGRGGGHRAVVAAHLEQANGGPRNTNNPGRDARRPLSTATTTGSQQRVVETTLIEEGALPPEMMARATMVAAFLIKYYGEGGQSQAASAPLDVVTTKARYAVITVTIDAVTYVIVDIGLRMLKPRELARAQGFPESYVLDPIVRKIIRGKWVERRLTIAEQISAIGNSVCPPVARALVAANQPGITEMRMAA